MKYYLTFITEAAAIAAIIVLVAYIGGMAQLIGG